VESFKFIYNTFLNICFVQGADYRIVITMETQFVDRIGVMIEESALKIFVKGSRDKLGLDNININYHKLSQIIINIFE